MRDVHAYLLIASALVAVCLGMPSTPAANAAAAVQVTAIDCVKHPSLFDLVYIKNNGDTAQDLAGWQLRSDPEDSQRMSLAPAGVLDPGEEIIIVAGAHGVNLPNENLYLWTNSEILRDSGDPPDYARLLDAAGNSLGGLDCNSQAWSPAPAPTAPPAPAPAQPATQDPATAQPASQGQPAAAPRPAGAPKSVPAAGGAPSEPAFSPLAGLGLAAVLAGALLMLSSVQWGRSPARIPIDRGGTDAPGRARPRRPGIGPGG